MANYNGTTVSEGGKLKPNSEKAIGEIIAKYEFGNEGELNIEIQDGNLCVWGYDSSVAHAYITDGSQDEQNNVDDEDVFDTFLHDICPFLDEPLIVSEVGSEKCRYVNAYAYIARPTGEVECVSLNNAISEALQDHSDQALRCTHPGCNELQVEDGEFCRKHI